MASAMTAQQFQEVYTWTDTVTLSRQRKNINRDFADGVLCAELVHHFLPKLVELHNYNPANSASHKRTNWNTLNRKVLTRLGCRLGEAKIQQIIDAEPGAIESFLIRLKQNIYKILNKSPSRPVIPASPIQEIPVLRLSREEVCDVTTPIICTPPKPISCTPPKPISCTPPKSINCTPPIPISCTPSKATNTPPRVLTPVKKDSKTKLLDKTKTSHSDSNIIGENKTTEAVGSKIGKETTLSSAVVGVETLKKSRGSDVMVETIDGQQYVHAEVTFRLQDEVHRLQEELIDRKDAITIMKAKIERLENLVALRDQQLHSLEERLRKADDDAK